MKRILGMISLTMIVAVAAVSSSFGQGYEFSGTTTSSGGIVTGTSTGGTYSNISFDVPAGTTLADLQTLSTDYSTPDGCGGGSPRFTVITNEGGIYDFFWTCVAGASGNTGNLADGNVDVRGSHPYQYQADFDAVQTQFGSETIKSISLIVDGSWFFPDGSQEVTFDNVVINDTTYTFQTPGSANQCKNNGWKGFKDASGAMLFKNQGQCVSSVNSNRGGNGNQ